MTEVQVSDGDTYNALHGGLEFSSKKETYNIDDDRDTRSHRAHSHGREDGHDSHEAHSPAKAIAESMDFEAVESVMWRKHQLRRFFQDRGHWWNSGRRSTVWKWTLVIVVGLLVGVTGAFVQVLTEKCTEWKLESTKELYEEGDFAGAYFCFVLISLFLVSLAGFLCWHEPAAAGSGIPEIIAFLNGVNLDKVVRVRVVIAKVLGMCFSCAAGLPLGKEGPMIHAGSIIGAAAALGQTITLGYDTSWNKFQDFRNDRSKLDFVAIGAAAGIGAAFRAPIGGVLFVLEEGASYWSNTLTVRSFVCAMITMLTVSLIFAGPGLGRGESAGIFTFGQFDNIEQNKTNFYIYELLIFIIMGAGGGVLGALFNRINEVATIYRIKHINAHKWKRFIELLLITGMMSSICFILSIMWQHCTKVPSDTSFMSEQEKDLIKHLVRFQCKEGEYNELASLYMTSADTAMRQLMHYREFEGTPYATFTAGPLLLFFIPYFLMAAITAGILCPAGLFVPTLLAGAAYGRLWGHIMNSIAPGYVADSGTYALIGASALLGGMARMTISGTVIILEAAGNIAYLLPLMVTFFAARYSGNAINHGMYEIQIHLKKIPFLESSLHSLGILNFCPVTEIMIKDVITVNEVEKVKNVYKILKESNHNGFPVVNNEGQLKGLILRRTLTTLLKLKAYSTPQTNPDTKDSTELNSDGATQLVPVATVFYDTLERSYPLFPDVEELKLSKNEMELYLDMRPYMDTAPYSIDSTASVHRTYKFFRTMGLRHLTVVDHSHVVVGIITRFDLTEHNLKHKWSHEGGHLQKFINVEPIPAAVVYEGTVRVDKKFSKGPDGGGDDNGHGGHGENGANNNSNNNNNHSNSIPFAERVETDSSYAEDSSDTHRNREFSVDASAGLSESPQFGAYRKSLSKQEVSGLPSMGMITPLTERMGRL
eukprot:gene3432-6812_t